MKAEAMAAHRFLGVLLVAGICSAVVLLVADATTDALFTETSHLRELPILKPIKSSALSRAEIERKVIAATNEQTTPEQARASELALKKLGLLPADFRLRHFQTSLLTEQIAGLYDPKAQEFYLADWIDASAQQPVIVHELTHALQDQHYNLRRLAEWPKGDSDAQMAAHSLVEGDATLAMTHYLLNKPDVALAFLSSALGTPKMPVFESAPRALRESLTFPFVQGMEFTTALHKRGGWKAVSAAYDPLPQSTEQILHIEKYDAREAPVKVTLPDVARLLGEGWTRLDSDVTGEWGYFIVLDQFLAAPRESRRAAAGWGGDRLDVYERAGQSLARQCLVVQMTAWDTAEDARDFFDAYARRTLMRYPAAKASTSSDKEADRRSWLTSEGGVAMELRGSRVLIVEGVPASADAAGVVRALWR
jgi:hypothetical protein